MALLGKKLSAAFRSIRQGRLLVLFILCVLVPTIPLAYLALRSLAGEQKLAADNIHEHLQRIGVSLSRMLTRPISDCEAELGEYIPAGTTLESLIGDISPAEKACPFIDCIFILDDRMEKLFPFGGLGNNVSDFTRGPLAKENAAVYSQPMSAGGIKEFVAADYPGAIEDYRVAIKNARNAQLRSIAMNGAARCCVRLNKDEDALSYYVKIANELDRDVVYGGLSIKLLARYQVAEIEKRMGHFARAADLFIGIMKELVAGRLASGGAEAEFYASKISQQLRELSSGKDANTRLAADFESASRQWESARQRSSAIEKVRTRFKLDFQKAIDDSGEASGSPRVIGRVLDGRETLLMYHVLKVADRQKPLIMVAVFNTGEIVKEVRELCGSAMESESDVNVTLADTIGNTVFQKGRKEDGSGFVSRRTLSSALPLWQLTLVYRKNGLLFQVALHERRNRLSYITLLILVIVLGLYLIYRLIKKDSELAKLKSDFVSRVSHDLRTPLSTIRSVSEMLEMGAVSNKDKEKEYFSFITSESQRLSRLIDNVLDFSRIGAGRRTYAMRPTDMRVVVESTVDSFRRYVKADGFVIEYDADKDIPLLAADVDAIGQALFNLLDNAVKFSREEKIVRVELRRLRGEIVVRVRDRGIGIAPEDIDKIFSQFYRADASRYISRKGAGIGLSIVKHVADAHGGRAEVESTLGEGSTFSLVLPM